MTRSILHIRATHLQKLYLEAISDALGETMSSLVRGICDGRYEVIRKPEPEEPS